MHQNQSDDVIVTFLATIPAYDKILVVALTALYWLIHYVEPYGEVSIGSIAVFSLVVLPCTIRVAIKSTAWWNRLGELYAMHCFAWLLIQVMNFFYVVQLSGKNAFNNALFFFTPGVLTLSHGLAINLLQWTLCAGIVAVIFDKYMRWVYKHLFGEL